MSNSNILTNFNINNGTNFDILSTIVSVNNSTEYYFNLGQLLIQFGNVSSNATYNYPVPFPVLPYSMCLGGARLGSVTNSSFVVNSLYGMSNYIAIGPITNSINVTTSNNSNILTNFNISDGAYCDIISSVKNNNGYYFYLGQLLIQFSNNTSVSSSSIVTFPISYTSLPYTLLLTLNKNTSTAAMCLKSLTTSNFTISFTSNLSLNYIVIGPRPDMVTSTDGSINFSNIETKFNINNGANYDIISTMVGNSGNSNKIKLISSDPQGVFYGNAFVLGQLLIQFSIADLTASETSSSDQQIIYFPYNYDSIYTVYLTQINVNISGSNQVLNSYNARSFNYTMGGGSSLNFLAIGPLPTTSLPPIVNMNYTYNAGSGIVSWNITNNNTTMTVTYNVVGQQTLIIYRPYQSINYSLLGASGGGGSGETGNANNYPGAGGGGGGGGNYIVGVLTENNNISLNITVGGLGLGGGASTDGSNGTNGGNSSIVFNSTTITSNGGSGGVKGVQSSGRGGTGGNGGDGSIGTYGGSSSNHTGTNATGRAGSGGGWDDAHTPGKGGTAQYGGAGGTAGMWANDGDQTSGAVSTYGGDGGRSGYHGGGSSAYTGGVGGNGILAYTGSGYYSSGGGGGGGGWANDSGGKTGGGNGGNGANGTCVIVVSF